MSNKADAKDPTEEKLVLQLYVSGMSPKSMEAIGNINRFCTEFLKEGYDLEIIDLYKYPELAAEQQIVFSPSLIRRFPAPRKILVGSLSDTEKILRALGITVKE